MKLGINIVVFRYTQSVVGLLVAILMLMNFNIINLVVALVAIAFSVVNFLLISDTKASHQATKIQGKQKEAEVVKLKAEFLANMSHELRTPLNSIIGFSQMLQDQVIGDLNEQQLRYVSYILNGGKNLEQMINDILDLAKIESGKSEIMLEEFLLSEVIAEVVAGLNELIGQKQLDLVLDISGDMIITADKLKLKQILFNLLSNAVKFTPNGGRITLLASEIDSGILMSVTDTGIGIRESDIGRIFELFEQGDSSFTKSHHGTGLGLALVKTLVEMHGGRILVESDLGRGSTFTFVIPMAKEKIVKLEA